MSLQKVTISNNLSTLQKEPLMLFTLHNQATSYILQLPFVLRAINGGAIIIRE